MTEREVMVELVGFVGVMTYGKERWFKQTGCFFNVKRKCWCIGA